MKTVTFKIPDAYVEAIDELVKKGYYQSRSSFIRLAVIRLLKIEQMKGRLADTVEDSEEAKEPVEEEQLASFMLDPKEEYDEEYNELVDIPKK